MDIKNIYITSKSIIFQSNLTQKRFASKPYVSQYGYIECCRKEKMNVKKKMLNIIPFIIGLIYLAYCLINVDAWVKSHTEKYLFFVFLVWFIAVIIAVVFIGLRLIKKRNLKMYLPIFFFVIGLIVYVVALNIPCCTGG